MAAADAHPEAGAVGGMVTWPGGERVQTAGLVLWNDCSHSEVGAGSSPDDWAERDAFAVDYCSSSSLLVRGETWDALGGLDDSFFPAGHVDADLAMRIRSAERAVLVEPRARSRHSRGASSTKPFKRFIAVRNAELFLERWGAELARTQEPPGERGAAELERAPGRAEERRSRCARRPATAPAGEPRESPDVDPLRFSRRELALHQAYVSELEPALEHFESEAGGLRRQVAELNERLRERDEQLAAITQGGWWRLRERLLPVLEASAARSRWGRG